MAHPATLLSLRGGGIGAMNRLRVLWHHNGGGSYNSNHDLMDYDATAIPLAYDRGRSHGREVVDLWMQTVERYSGSLRLSTILDLGCGTGRFSDALATWF